MKGGNTQQKGKGPKVLQAPYKGDGKKSKTRLKKKAEAGKK